MAQEKEGLIIHPSIDTAEPGTKSHITNGQWHVWKELGMEGMW